MTAFTTIRLTMLAAFVVVSGNAAAQDAPIPAVQTADDLVAVEQRFRLGEPIVIVDRLGRRHEGVFRQSTASSIFVMANGQTEEIPPDGIGRIEKSGDPLLNGIVLGVVSSAPYWLLSTALACDGRGPACAAGSLVFSAGIFAALGAYVDWRHVGTNTVYGPRKQKTAPSLDTLWMSITSGDIITVTAPDERKTRGVFQFADREGVALLVDGQMRSLAGTDVERVARRGDSLRNGTAIGAVLGVLSASEPCHSTTPYNFCPTVEERLFFGALEAVIMGGLGALIDSLHVGQTTVFRSTRGRVSARIRPYAAPGTRGMVVSVGF